MKVNCLSLSLDVLWLCIESTLYSSVHEEQVNLIEYTAVWARWEVTSFWGEAENHYFGENGEHYCSLILGEALD